MGFKYPNVDLYDDTDEMLIPSGVFALTSNTLRIDFAVPTIGNAILSTGGQKNISSSLFNQTGSIWTSTNDFQITGSLVVTGDIDAFNFNTTSDKKLKTNIVKLENSLDKIEKINGYTFNWLQSYNEDTTRQIGMIADEVYDVQPELISKRRVMIDGVDMEVKLLDYSKVTALLIEAVKELNDKIKKLEK
jgi:hypothetical protein